jgi:hypothetical protein
MSWKVSHGDGSPRHDKREPRFGQLQLRGVDRRQHGATRLDTCRDLLESMTRRDLRLTPLVDVAARAGLHAGPFGGTLGGTGGGTGEAQHLQPRHVDRLERQRRLKPLV